MVKVFNNRIKKLIDTHDVISFDVFDTLIKRNCLSPKDIFTIVEMKYNRSNNDKIVDFKKKRTDAERNARFKFSMNEDITIEQIYSIIDYPKDISKKLKKLEIEVELDFCQKNNQISELFEYCLDNNKTIICISDMYLDKDTINKILKNSGYNINNIYVSCELNMTKLSGKIFDYVLKDLNIDKKRMLHIGDSWKADFLAPIKKGICSYHIAKFENNCMYIKKDKDFDITTNVVYSFINNNVILNKNEYEKMGFEIIGPLCVQFCYWINAIALKNNINNLLFCARDMKMIQEIFNNFFGDKINNSYFYVSRKSTYLPYLYVNNDFNFFKDLIPSGRRKISISELLGLYNINISEKKLRIVLKKYGFDINEKYDFELLKENNRLKDFYVNEILPIVKKDGKIQYNNFLLYLKKLNYNKRTALVDLGWRGTTQNIMIDITKQNLFGMYLGLHSLNGKNLNGNYYTFLFEGQENGYSDKIYSFMSLCELFLSALHGSTVSYNDNYKEPFVLDSSINKDNFFINSLQKGGLLFGTMLSKFSQYLEFSDMSKFFVNNFIEIGINPSYKQAKILGDIYTENIKVRKLCDCKSLLYYCFHVRELKNDFLDSEWKIGFMKRLFVIPLPYYYIYSFLKKIGK